MSATQIAKESIIIDDVTKELFHAGRKSDFKY